MNRALALALVVVSSFTFVACDDATGGVGQQDSDVDAGPSCQWSGAGNKKYREAVEAAKAWGKQECMVLQTEVFDIAQEAVGICPAVGGLIAESEWAGALRTALGPLEVGYLAGDLDGEGDALNPDAVAEALDGQTLWAPGQGAYGSPRIVHLGAGTYELERLVSDDEGVTIERRVTSGGTFAVSADADGSILLTFSPEEGADELENLGNFRMNRYTGWEGVELFRFAPAAGEVEDWSPEVLFAANVSECDA